MFRTRFIKHLVPLTPGGKILMVPIEKSASERSDRKGNSRSPIDGAEGESLSRQPGATKRKSALRYMLISPLSETLAGREIHS